MQMDICAALFQYDVKKKNGLSRVNKTAGCGCQSEVLSGLGVGEME